MTVVGAPHCSQPSERFCGNTRQSIDVGESNRIELEAVAVGGIVGGFGAVLSGLHLVHGLEEISGNVAMVLSGTVLPLFVGIFVTASGYWILRRNWIYVSPRRMATWVGGGTTAGIGLAGLLVLYQAAEQVVVSDPLFVLAMFGTYGAAAGVVLGRYDVLHREQHHRQRREARRLEEFASIVSHDLRNPLQVAEGHLELAAEDCDSEHVDGAARTLDRMHRLVDDLLALATEGEGTLEVEPVDLAEMADRCWETVDSDGGTLETESAGTIRADPDRLQQLLENLLGNALDHGGPDVTVIVGTTDEGFFVADDGAGIPAEDRESVFEWGYTTAEEGTGYGLAIVEAIAGTHGWDVAVTESADGGARFEFTGVEVAP